MDPHAPAAESDLPIEHREEGERGAFRIDRDGKRLGELTYARHGGRATLDHTFVDHALRGQGVAKRLVVAAVEWARRTGTKLDATCPYAKAVLDRERSFDDVKA